MGHYYAPLSYEEMLNDFRDGLDRVLSGATPPATVATSDVSMTLALLDIAHAVREKRPTKGLVTRACAAFAAYAADQERRNGEWEAVHPRRGERGRVKSI
jgi:hypothetical protein